MLEEALEKLDAGERDPAKVLGPIVPIPEGDLPVLDSLQTAGDGADGDVARSHAGRQGKTGPWHSIDLAPFEGPGTSANRCVGKPVRAASTIWRTDASNTPGVYITRRSPGRLHRSRYGTLRAESFAFRIDEDGTRMVSYSYHAGKQLLCPTLLIFESQCSLEQVADASTGQSPARSN